MTSTNGNPVDAVKRAREWIDETEADIEDGLSPKVSTQHALMLVRDLLTLIHQRDNPTPIDDKIRQLRYVENYKQLHGHEPGEPHTEACVPDPWHPDHR